jgi:hypothetical protein
MVVLFCLVVVLCSCVASIEVTTRMSGSTPQHTDFVGAALPPALRNASFGLSGPNGWSQCHLVGKTASDAFLFLDVDQSQVLVRAVGPSTAWAIGQLGTYNYVGAVSPLDVVALTSYNNFSLVYGKSGFALPSSNVACSSDHAPAFTADGKVLLCYGTVAGQYNTFVLAFKISAMGATLLWSTSLQFGIFVGGDASPITVDDASGRVWVSVSLSAPRVQSFDLATGKLLGTFGSGSFGNNAIEQPRLSPDGSIVYVLVNQWHLRAFDAADDGTKPALWNYTYSDATSRTASPYFAVVPSSGLVLLTLSSYAPTRRTFMKAFDGRTGAVQWEFNAYTNATTNPFGPLMVHETHDTALWLMWNTTMFAVDTKTGTGAQLDFSLGGYVLCSMLTSDGVLVAHRQDGKNDSIEFRDVSKWV